MDDRFLTLLSRDYPTVEAARSEIVNLTAICGLPKGTEYFFSDLHGEYEGFSDLLKGASGVIRDKIYRLFGNSFSKQQQNQLYNLIYDPENVLKLMHMYKKDTSVWMRDTIFRLILLCRYVSAKYSRKRVRSRINQEYSYIIEELLYPGQEEGKQEYCMKIIDAVIANGMGECFIPVLCRLIHSIIMDVIHIIGDIFDRGPQPDLIIEDLMQFDHVDIQWGNHDISWMGAVCGNDVLIANVVRMGISYNNFDCLEDAYGINLRPLSDFAAKVYADDPCDNFMPHILDENKYDMVDSHLTAKMHKAIAVIELKLMGALVRKHPEYHMESSSFLDGVDFERNVYRAGDKEYRLTDTAFPTIDKKEPLKLTPQEEALMHSLKASFLHSEQLRRHIRFLYTNGGMYLKRNDNLLFHGCIPMCEDGSFLKVNIEGKEYSGKALMDKLEKIAVDAFFLPEDSDYKQDCIDMMWVLWQAPYSPLYGKSKMSAFEKYFTDNKELLKEKMNPYYRLSSDKETCKKLLNEFGIDENKGHIINGHVPVRLKDGESPVKAGGMLYVIDGGLSKAYQSRTGIAGYTLIYNSHCIALAQHHNFITEKLSDTADISTIQITEELKQRKFISDTDEGAELRERIEELNELVRAYREGRIKQRSSNTGVHM